MAEYTTAEALLVKQMLKDIATLKTNHPIHGPDFDDATNALKNILGFFIGMLER